MFTKFDCPRTCPKYGEEACRFMPILQQLGPVKVNSHTAQLKTDFGDTDLLKMAVEAMGGKWLGLGTHHMFDGTNVKGQAFHLPFDSQYERAGKKIDGRTYWLYPCVVNAEGEMSYDHYNGMWGNPADLEKLKAAYNLSRVEAAAQLQGWQYQRQGDSITVYHPQQGEMTVTTAGAMNFQGFIGAGCHEMREKLGLPVEEGSITNTGEAAQVIAEARTGGR